VKSTSGTSSPADAGFLTAVFGASALALSVIALASLQLARSDYIASRRNWERLNEHYRAESLATLTAWRLMHTDQLAALHWRERFGDGAADIVAEPEGRKLSLSAIDELRGRRRLVQIFGQETTDRVLPRLLDLSRQARPPSRSEMLAADEAREWRACGLSVVSVHSQLTDDALVRTTPITTGTYGSRAGEVWRIAVAVNGRLLLDELIRFTGDAGQPIAVIDQTAGATSPVDCTAPKAGGTRQ